MFILLFIIPTLQTIIEGDCLTVFNYLQYTNQTQPMVALLYYRFGSLYNKIKPHWIEIADDHMIYVQIEMYEENCLSVLFDNINYPGVLFINTNNQYHYEFIPNEHKLLEFLSEPHSIETALPFPQYSLYKQIVRFIRSPIHSAIIIGILLLMFIIGLIKVRLLMYKDNIGYFDYEFDDDDKTKLI